MEKFVSFKGRVAPLDKVNVDTDQIIPKQFLKKIERTGFGVHLFHDWRFTDDAGKVENKNFILNKPDYRQAKILLAGDNFGCGSSREHAPWSLADFGFKVIVSSSFADIFYQNCFKNSLLPIALSHSQLKEIFAVCAKGPQEMDVNLEEQFIAIGEKSYSFEIDPNHKEALLQGLDDIGKTLKHTQAIAQFENVYNEKYPWYNNQIKRNA